MREDDLPASLRDARVTVVMPTYNEADNLPAAVRALLTLDMPNLHVLVCDDNSPDGTGALADELAAADTRVRVIHRPGKAGLGRAYVDGMSQAARDGAAYVVQMDADGSHPAGAVPEMAGVMLSTGADVVIGSRYVAGGSLDESWSLHRRLLSAWANFYVRTLLGMRIRDVTSGFKMWRASALKAIDLEGIQSNGYSFQVEMHYRASRRGLKIAEIPIHFTERTAGESKLSLRVQLESAWMPFRLRLKARD